MKAKKEILKYLEGIHECIADVEDDMDSCFFLGATDRSFLDRDWTQLQGQRKALMWILGEDYYEPIK